MLLKRLKAAYDVYKFYPEFIAKNVQKAKYDKREFNKFLYQKELMARSVELIHRNPHEPDGLAPFKFVGTIDSQKLSDKARQAAVDVPEKE